MPSTLNFWRQVTDSKYPEFEIPVYNSFLCIAQHIAVNLFALQRNSQNQTIVQP